MILLMSTDFICKLGANFCVEFPLLLLITILHMRSHAKLLCLSKRVTANLMFALIKFLHNVFRKIRCDVLLAIIVQKILLEEMNLM